MAATELAQAAAHGPLELHYQPLVDLRDNGLPARKRWRHPNLGLLSPGQFIPLAESSGLMPGVGAWVLREACRQMREWQALAWQPFRLAVNVSASQVGPTFDAEVKRVLASVGLPAELLEIELTESVAFGNPALFATCDALRAIDLPLFCRRLRHRLFLPATSEMLPHYHAEDRPIPFHPAAGRRP